MLSELQVKMGLRIFNRYYFWPPCLSGVVYFYQVHRSHLPLLSKNS